MDFSHLKIGDKIGVSDLDCWYLSESIEKIEDETPKFFIVKGRKFRKSDGRGYGTNKKLIPVEPVRDRLKAKRLADKQDRFKRYAETLHCTFSPEFIDDLESLIKKHFKP